MRRREKARGDKRSGEKRREEERRREDKRIEERRGEEEVLAGERAVEWSAACVSGRWLSISSMFCSRSVAGMWSGVR